MTSYSQITTLNQLIANVQEIATQHRQINDFKYGNTWEHYSSGTTNTPELWCNVESATRNINSTIYTIRFWVVDNVIRGELDELERHSDLVLIAEDIIAQLRNPAYKWLVSRTQSINIDLLVEYSPKNFAGASFSIDVEISKADERCNIPFIAPPISGGGGSGGGGGGDCDDANVRNSDASYTQTVASGGTLTLPDTTVNVYVNNVLEDTVTIVTLGNETINIIWQ